jgi:hypothetical protein
MTFFGGFATGFILNFFDAVGVFAFASQEWSEELIRQKIKPVPQAVRLCYTIANFIVGYLLHLVIPLFRTSSASMYVFSGDFRTACLFFALSRIYLIGHVVLKQVRSGVFFFSTDSWISKRMTVAFFFSFFLSLFFFFLR